MDSTELIAQFQEKYWIYNKKSAIHSLMYRTQININLIIYPYLNLTFGNNLFVEEAGTLYAVYHMTGLVA